MSNIEGNFLGNAVSDADYNNVWGDRSGFGNCYVRGITPCLCTAYVPWQSGTFTRNHVLTYCDGSYNYTRQKALVDIQWGILNSWGYYAGFGLNGIDGLGYYMIGRGHYGFVTSTNNSGNGAFWNGSTMAFGDGDGTQLGPLTEIDVVGHEYTHGVTQKLVTTSTQSGLTYTHESGAANESFSDIFGTMIEHVAHPGKDWLLGAHCVTPGVRGGALRNMANPPAYNQPDHYSNRVFQGLCVPSDANDNCGVHVNSGIMNKAFFLLAAGGTHPKSGIFVRSIGEPHAASIFFKALNDYVRPNDNFNAIRVATESAARDLYGTCSKDFREIVRAWHAVGVGSNTPTIPTSPCPANYSYYMNQSVPTTMVAGTAYNVSVTMKNTSNITWSPGNYLLGSQNLQDNTWGTRRVALPTFVAPESDVTFNFTVTAPYDGDAHDFKWQMVSSGGEWFGEQTDNVNVAVTANCSLKQECLTRIGTTSWNWNYSTCRCERGEIW